MPFRPLHSPIPATAGTAFALALLLLLFPPFLPAVAMGGACPADRLAGYTWLTEEYYPFNYEENGVMKGVAVDLLRLVWAELGTPEQPVESLPWARAYARLRHEPATVLFCMARTPERERAFRWAGPIASVRFVLIARKDRHIRLRSLDDLQGLSVGTLREDVLDTLLAGYKTRASIQPVARMRQNIDKLMTGRLDLVAYEEGSWRKITAREGLDPDGFETVYVLRETPVYFAFHPDTPPELVDAFQAALDKVKARPGYRKLLDAYLR
ncbi:Bacterial extracellular solute-binding protein, family 3 [Pseudodesulfovibrio hydrargyri]|uniref:Bacterial extracellular solute-binding protein, family 3 n=1 Tax=Pseudodesulfovibrio hydrargyri TaxID=2125990 RepID=A0A1J5NC55_9BACT|nr:transporter substrate-binding domain-containing protein [Pseudodesulfovibrio hydrargyri]OIQ49321.1 Bacterial extracellular solute-binding protein, family 3 [Pseudodesulfovibrio hydrargyri]